MRLAACLFALAVFISGCVAAPDTPAAVTVPDAEPLSWAAASTGTGCRFFCEPNVAVDGEGRVFVLGDTFARSDDGGATFKGASLPPSPIPGTFQNDALLQTAPNGDLWFSALLTTCVAICPPMLLAGIQVASTNDGGATWNSVLLSAPSHVEGAGADRQWLSFSPKGLVCVSFQFIGPTYAPTPVDAYRSDLRVSCSPDGKNFPEFVSATPGEYDGLINGRPSFDSEGRMYIPYFRYDKSPPLQVGVSEDGGRTFEARAVGGTGAWFPALAIDASDVLHMVWSDYTDNGALRHSTSADQGRTWSEPVTIAPTSVSSPWIEARGDGIIGAWFVQQDDERNSLYFWDGDNVSQVASNLKDSTGRPAATDFAHFAMGADGRVLTIYGDLEKTQTILARSSEPLVS